MPNSSSVFAWTALGVGFWVGCGNTETHPAAQVSNDAGAPAQGPGEAGAGGTTGSAPLAVVGVLARPAGSCTLRSEPGAALLARGTLDRLFAKEYTAGLLVGDSFADRVSLSSIEIELTDSANHALREPYSTSASGFVEPSSDGVVFASIIPATVAAALPVGDVIAKVRVSGKTLTDGRVLESPQLVFPIEICDGCLVEYPESARDPQAAGASYQCRVPAAGEADPAPAPCELGIDEAFSCTLCAATVVACTSPANNPSH